MPDLFEGLTLGQVRRELGRLIAQADSAERPKPDIINPPGHTMPGPEWRIAQRDIMPNARPPLWIVRSVDDSETPHCVYLAMPDPHEYDWEYSLDFAAMTPTDARRLAMAILAAADRAEHLGAGVPRLEDRRTNA